LGGAKDKVVIGKFKRLSKECFQKLCKSLSGFRH
jgi:hypothetical protein